MELSVCRSFDVLSRPPPCPHSSQFVIYSGYFGRKRVCERLRWRSKPLSRIRVCVDRDGSINGVSEVDSDCSINGVTEINCLEFWRDSKFVEVIGIGSRTDAVLDFCLNSRFWSMSASLRFWNFLMNDSENVQLQERVNDKDLTPQICEAPRPQSCPKAIIIVASAGYGLDHITAIDILKTVRSANGFAAAIILRPFSFEGQRRLDEVIDLEGKLKEHSDFLIQIDMDALLEKDLVTLDEALRTANNAVLLATKAVSVLISETHKKVSEVGNSSAKCKEINVSEVIKVMNCHKEAKLGFGIGNNIGSSIVQAIKDCPFLGVGLKDLNGVVICILASSVEIGSYDALHSLRRISDYKGEIIVSTTLEPELDPNLVVTTVAVLGCIGKEASPKTSILSRLAQRFPLVFNLLRKTHPESNMNPEDNATENPTVSKVSNSPESDEWQSRSDVNGMSEDFPKQTSEIQTLSSSYYTEKNVLRNQNSYSEKIEAIFESSNFYDHSSEGPPLQREQLIDWNVVPGYQIAPETAKETAADFEVTKIADNLSIFHLPVGVKPSKELEDSANISSVTQNWDPEKKEGMKNQPPNSGTSSWDAFTGIAFGALKKIYNAEPTLTMETYTNVAKKQEGLSVRAASMLEAERDSPKKWSPIVEMQYRGGVYKGRCQGGLPEGKGRLVLADGCIYDGMWRYGKRSGLGTFYFSNGDVFQGSWRDDVIHGKGWCHFHTGDRWFANFWKGKAYGESRFYSNSGYVLFGDFQDGWRHGRFLFIEADGERYIEIWDAGVLIDRKSYSSAG